MLTLPRHLQVADMFDALPIEASLIYMTVNNRPRLYVTAFPGFLGVVEQVEPGKGSLPPVPISSHRRLSFFATLWVFLFIMIILQDIQDNALAFAR